MWDDANGNLVRSLKGHGHWVNTLALSSECALRTGAFDHHGRAPPGAEEQEEVRRAAWHAAGASCMRLWWWSAVIVRVGLVAAR